MFSHVLMLTYLLWWLIDIEHGLTNRVNEWQLKVEERSSSLRVCPGSILTEHKKQVRQLESTKFASRQ